MAVKMIQFTNEEEDDVIVKQLVNYLNRIHNYSQLVNIDKLLIDKITDILNKQLQKHRSEFTSKEFILKFNSLKKQLKSQLQLPTTINKPIVIQNSAANDNLPITYPTSQNLGIKSTPSRYSILSKKTPTMSLAETTAIDYLAQAKTAYQQRKYNEAINLFEKAAETCQGNDKRAPMLCNIGHSYFALKDYVRAISSYNDVLKISPTSITAYEWRAKSYKKLAELPEYQYDKETLLVKASQDEDKISELRQYQGSQLKM